MIEFSRAWAMPNKNTFSIKPIKEFIERVYLENQDAVWIDPFCGKNDLADETNDLNPEVKADCHLDVIEYLSHFPNTTRANLFFDPPYSPRQISECYKSVGIKTNMQTTQSSWYADVKDEIARITKKGNVVVSASWNSNGVGMGRGFKLYRQLNVARGGWHNDTIVIAERKVS